MKITKFQILLLCIVLTGTFADLYIKELILDTFNGCPYPISQSISVIGDFFRLTYVQNFGITFGLLSDLPPMITKIMLSIISVIAFGVLIFFYKNMATILKPKVLLLGQVTLALIFGGALGNIIDRIMRGFVVDYLDFGWAGYRWYTFNLADVLIVTGCIVLGILMTFFEIKPTKNKTTS